MYLFENPVLQRELVVNLRMTRGFLLLFAYVALLGLLVYAAWPADQTLDLARPEEAKKLVNLFFLGQYLLVSLMTPSFAAGAITGEKERESYEMLLASPLRPGAIVLGKLAASLTPLAELMICSLPIVMLCLPLGGVSLYEVLAAYLAMICSVALFGMISLWCSSYFTRTSAVAGRLVPADPAAGDGRRARVAGAGASRRARGCGHAHRRADRLPVDRRAAVGRRLPPAAPPARSRQRRQAGDRPRDRGQGSRRPLHRPRPVPRPPLLRRPSGRRSSPRTPIRSTTRKCAARSSARARSCCRLVIQISMGLALPVMAVCLFMQRQLAPWYIAYVLLFNMLVGPVFSADSVTSERERSTLDLLLTTLITPWQMLWGKLLSGLRVSSVLTSFLLWPVFLACIMPLDYWDNMPTMGGYFLIVGLTVRDHRDDGAVLLDALPQVVDQPDVHLRGHRHDVPRRRSPPSVFAQTFARGLRRPPTRSSWSQVISPFAAAFNLPLDARRRITQRRAASTSDLLGLRGCSRSSTTSPCWWA